MTGIAYIALLGIVVGVVLVWGTYLPRSGPTERGHSFSYRYDSDTYDPPKNGND